MQHSLIIAALVLAACGPRSAAPSAPQRPCAESQEARASGVYLQQKRGTGEHDAYDVYDRSCYRSCQAGDAGACVEYRLLFMENEWPRFLTIYDAEKIEEFCAEGQAAACAWLDHADHRARIAALRGGEPYVEPEPGPVDRAASDLIAQLSADGFTLLEGSTYSMEGGGIYFSFEAKPGDGVYRFLVVADRAMPFTAEVGSTALTAYSYSDDVSTMAGDVTLAQGSTTSISIQPTGTERSDIKFLVFGKLGD